MAPARRPIKRNKQSVRSVFVIARSECDEAIQLTQRDCFAYARNDILMQPFSLSQLILYFLKLGTIGFGGPIALVGYMEQDLVEKKGWFSRKEYLNGLALAQMVPGPVAAQMAIYFGWLKGKILGATGAAIAFILPSFLMVWGLSLLYVRYQNLSWIDSALYGMSAAVIAIFIQATVKLSKISLEKRKGLWLIFIAVALTTAAYEKASFLYFFLSGILSILIYAFPKKSRLFIFPPLQLFLFFAKAAVVVYGSGLAIIPFIYHDVVERYHWLTQKQFLDAVSVGMMTPGPMMITAGFIGFMVDHFAGALASVIGVFLPVYLFVIILAPIFHKILRNAQAQAFVEGVTAAAVGAIAGTAFILGQKAIVDWPTALIALVALGVVFKTKIPIPLLLLSAGVVGVGIKMIV